MGDLKDAEGTIGLQRAFLSKGARSVLVSLWNVNDQATARLIEEFYTRWRATPGVSKAEALRLAQKRVYEEINPSPYYWAAFQLAGGR
jgi:CHAT domain-containing protein